MNKTLISAGLLENLTVINIRRISKSLTVHGDPFTIA